MVLNPRDIMSLSRNHRVISLPTLPLMGTRRRERGDESQVLCHVRFSTNSTVSISPWILVRLLREDHEG